MIASVKLTKPTFKKIEAEWYVYHKTLQEIANLREEIMSSADQETNEQGKNSVRQVGKPTEMLATRLVTHKQLKYLTEVTDAIERVYEALPSDYKKLVRLRYWNKTIHVSWDMLSEQLNVSKRQAMRWRDEIVIATAEILGWR